MELKTKLDIGNEAFFISNSKIVSSTIKKIKIEAEAESIEITYLCNKNDDPPQLWVKVDEKNAFKSKKLLIDSL